MVSNQVINDVVGMLSPTNQPQGMAKQAVAQTAAQNSSDMFPLLPPLPVCPDVCVDLALPEVSVAGLQEGGGQVCGKRGGGRRAKATGSSEHAEKGRNGASQERQQRQTR